MTGWLNHNIVRFLLIVMFLPSAGCNQPASTLALVMLSKGANDTLPGFAPRTDEASSCPHDTFPVSRYSDIVQKYSDRYNVDWTLVVAVIREESSFRANVVSRKGAYGLMQLMPRTRSELVRKLGLKDARNPPDNIRGGIFQLMTLYRIFRYGTADDRISLTLAAYNAGLGRVLDAMAIAAYLGYDPHSWGGVRRSLPMLAERYKSLHQYIWKSGRPTFGYMRDCSETVRYVEKVKQDYNDYALTLR
ncbi:MAG TPA: transglycosylase SLT domain-containing protein [Bacteroidota bacterium]